MDKKIVIAIGAVLLYSLAILATDHIMVRGPKSSLTIEEVKMLESTNTLTGYDLCVVTAKGESFESHIDFETKSASVTPPFNNINNLTLVNSGIEDGMIYTLCSGELNSGEKCEVLYINEPTSLEFVAAWIGIDGLNLSYTYYDKNKMTVYDRMAE